MCAHAMVGLTFTAPQPPCSEQPLSQWVLKVLKVLKFLKVLKGVRGLKVLKGLKVPKVPLLLRTAVKKVNRLQSRPTDSC